MRSIYQMTILTRALAHSADFESIETSKQTGCNDASMTSCGPNQAAPARTSRYKLHFINRSLPNAGTNH